MLENRILTIMLWSRIIHAHKQISCAVAHIRDESLYSFLLEHSFYLALIKQRDYCEEPILKKIMRGNIGERKPPSINWFHAFAIGN